MFTGAVSSPAPFADPATAEGPADGAHEAPPATDQGRRWGTAPSASAYWRGWPEVRADLRSAAGIVAGLALAGVPAGLLWWALAPRADFRITETGPVPIGEVSPELLVADDAVLALALGTCVTAVVAWQVGELLGAGPSEAQLADVGARVTTSLTLSSPAAMALAPFTALLAYVVGVLYTPDDGLGRTQAPSGGSP